MINRFENKIAVVTGGCRGIGKAIVERLLNEGAFVFALDYVIPSSDEVFIHDNSISSNVICLQCDVGNEESVNNAFNTIIEEKKRLDILVNNAGITRDNLMMRMKTEEWDAVINTNLKGTFLCSKAAVRTMMSQKSGSIVNIGSVVGTIGNAGQVNYSASKAGMIGFTKSMAREVGSRGITVNCVAPGFVLTPMTDKLTEDQKKQFLENIPLKRAATPEDIANAVTFLVSNDASYITGHVLHVNGGLAM